MPRRKKHNARRTKRRIREHLTENGYHIDSVEVTRLKKPLYDGFAIGHGTHGTKGYNRHDTKRATRRLIEEEL